MKKFFIVIIFMMAGIIWLNDWSSSGKMDLFLKNHENSKVTPKVIHLIGEAYFLSNDRQDAARYYSWLVEKYPDMPVSVRARFKLAECYEDMGERGKAMEQYIVLKDSFSATYYGVMAKRKWELAKY